MASASSSSSAFLYYPTDDPADEVDEAADPKAEKLKSKPLSKDRLYVGNLHPTVDEYTLLTLFSKHGTIKSMDYLFHKTGPSRGKPRGFAFIEFAEQSSALSALSALHDKLLRGRKLVVTFAHQAPTLTSHTPGGKKRGTDATKPTTLSLLKTGRGNGPNSTDKIALLEAKLLQMSSSSILPPIPAVSVLSTSSPLDTDMAPPRAEDDTPPSRPSPPPSAQSQVPVPAHPSLPPKPAPPPITSFHLPSQHSASASYSNSSSNLNANGKRPRLRQELPTLSQLQQTRLGSAQGQAISSGFAASLAGSYTPSLAVSPAKGAPKEIVGSPSMSPNVIQPSAILPGVPGITTSKLGSSLAMDKMSTSPASHPKPAARGPLIGVKIVKTKK